MQLQEDTAVKSTFIKAGTTDHSVIQKSLSDKVLTIGPDHVNHRGGIGAVLSAYNDFYETFHFIPTYKYHNKNFTKSFFYLKQVGVLVKTLIQNRQIRIVHIHGAQRGSFYRKFVLFLIAKKLFGKKVVYHMHSDCFDTYYKNSPGIQRRLIRYFVNNVDLLICLAPYWQNFFLENFKTRHVQIINNVIPKPAVSGIKQTPVDEKSPVNFLFLGRIGHRKGIFDILNVVKENKEQLKGKMRLFAGGDGETEKLTAFIKDNQLEEIVTYVGWIQGEDKYKLLAKADVYILPSYSEGLPISILEAMSFKLPVISTPVGGIPEVITNDINGKLVSPGNTEEIGAAMLFFINNRSKLGAFGEASYERIAPFFPDYVSGQLRDAYEKLLTKNNHNQ